MRVASISLAVVVTFACSAPAPAPLTDARKAAIADSAKAFMQATMASADRLDWAGYLANFSPDADATYAEAGALYPSYAAYKQGYEALGPQFEKLQQNVDSYAAIVLSPDAVAATETYHFTIKMKQHPEISGTGVWTGVLQRRANGWRIVQSHESLANQIYGARCADWVSPAPSSK